MSVLTTREPMPMTRILPPALLPAQLRSVDGTQLIATIPVHEETTIGRALDVTLRFPDDPYISARHAVISWDGLLEMHVISDNTSLNGTFVDDIRVVGPVRLVNGACVRLGVTEVVYCAPRER